MAPGVQQELHTHLLHKCAKMLWIHKAEITRQQPRGQIWLASLFFIVVDVYSIVKTIELVASI